VVQSEEDKKLGESDPLVGDTGETSGKKKRSKVIKIEQIRDLCAFLNYTAQYGGYKIALLEPADRLNLNAANSLLKTLEEPPGNSLLLVSPPNRRDCPPLCAAAVSASALIDQRQDVAVAWLAAQVAQLKGERCSRRRC
jgi:DNA polymerase-3 subunit delta'